jgi:hypothetical protein
MRNKLSWNRRCTTFSATEQHDEFNATGELIELAS